jgi:hypothetical protein
MGRNNADFEHHIRVYRGVTGVTASQLLGSETGVGKHWSSDEGVADAFADPSSSLRGHKVGAMVSGLVHPDDVMTSEEILAHNAARPGKAIHTKPSSEKEISLRPGATVHVTGTRTYKPNGDVSEKTYKTPKKVKA